MKKKKGKRFLGGAQNEEKNCVPQARQSRENKEIRKKEKRLLRLNKKMIFGASLKKSFYLLFVRNVK